MSEDFKPGVEITGRERTNMEEPTGITEDRDFTEEENKNLMRMNEDDIIQGLINAADYTKDETKTMQIIRDGKIYFQFDIRPLSEGEYDQCKKKHTKYVRNKQLGMKLPEETNSVKYRTALVYQATVEADRKKLWDNKKVWNALNNKDMPIVTGLDVISYTLKAGEIDKIIDCIDKLSGYDSNLEEVAKN